MKKRQTVDIKSEFRNDVTMKSSVSFIEKARLLSPALF